MSDLDEDMRGGRILRVGKPQEPTDAARLCDIPEIAKSEVQKCIPGAFPSGIGGSRGGRGERGAQGSQGSGSQGPQGSDGAQGSQGAAGAQGSQGSGAQGAQGPAGAQGAQGSAGAQGSGALYQFAMGQQLDAFTLPFVNAGTELVSTAATLTTFRGSRGVPGTAGTTTIQLELNGVAVGGAILSWTPVDLAFAIKTVAIALAVVPGDRLSIRLTSAETGAEDVFGEAD